jgi:ABC-type dipeptide/oligopeptide/nickel transport system permease subunit
VTPAAIEELRGGGLGQGQSAAARAWRRIRRDPTALIGLGLIVVLVLVAIFGPLIAPHNPNYQFANGLNAEGLPVPPSREFPLGTDTLGRDLLSRIIYGARISLTVGVVANAIAIGVGTGVGLVAGYFGGLTETVLMRLTDVMLAFPSLLLAMALLTLIGPGLETVIVVIAFTSWASMARIVRGQVLSIKELEYVEAAKAIGASRWRILTRSILPQLDGVVLVYLTLNIASAVLFEASLSFLGIGVQPPTADWGAMISSGESYYQIAPWLFLFPGLALALMVFSFNLFGDGLRDALDPRGRGRPA